MIEKHPDLEGIVSEEENYKELTPAKRECISYILKALKKDRRTKINPQALPTTLKKKFFESLFKYAEQIKEVYDEVLKQTGRSPNIYALIILSPELRGTKEDVKENIHYLMKYINKTCGSVKLDKWLEYFITNDAVFDLLPQRHDERWVKDMEKTLRYRSPPLNLKND